jgi:hypothetical protein
LLGPFFPNRSDQRAALDGAIDERSPHRPP